jgi:antitoxin HigA-1
MNNKKELKKEIGQQKEKSVAKSLPTHPGKLLKEDLFEPRGLTTEKVAQDIHVPLTELQKLIEGKNNLTTDLACRLGLYFQLEARGFLNLQQIYDLKC